MPRQPYLQLVSSTAPTNVNVGTDAIGKRPELEKLVGACQMAWPHVEAEMALYLGELLGTETPSTLAVFQALRRASGQREAVLAAGRIELNGTDLELLEAILTVHKATEAERTALAHGHFGISDNVPDCLLWMNTNDYVAIRMALGRKGPDDAVVKELLSRVWVYKNDALSTIFADIKEMARIWCNLTRYDRLIEGPERASFYDELCARPRVKKELERRRADSNPPTKSLTVPPKSRLRTTKVVTPKA
jgi:hypothetical protein